MTQEDDTEFLTLHATIESFQNRTLPAVRGCRGTAEDMLHRQTMCPHAMCGLCNYCRKHAQQKGPGVVSVDFGIPISTLHCRIGMCACCAWRLLSDRHQGPPTLQFQDKRVAVGIVRVSGVDRSRLACLSSIFTLAARGPPVTVRLIGFPLLVSLQLEQY